MGSSWTKIENAFPVFREDESPKESARKLHNYIYQLIQSLKYTLENLDTENWNDEALKSFSADTIKTVAADLSRLNGTVNTLQGRTSESESDIEQIGKVISDLELALQEAQERLTEVETAAGENRKDIDALQEVTAGIDQNTAGIKTNRANIEKLEKSTENLGQLSTDVQTLKETVQCAEESTTVGAAGKPLYLVGEIYINGVLYGEGGT